MLRFHRFRTLMVASAAVLVLAGCGGGRSVDPDKTVAPLPPQAETKPSVMAAGLDDAPLPLAPADTVTPVLEPGEANMEARIARLEETVNTLRSDYDRIMPAFASLNTTNQRIQALLDQMEGGGKPPALASSVQAFAVVPVAAKPEKPAAEAPKTQTAVSAPPTKGESTATVTGLRIGEHADKTRLVFDLKAPAKPEFTYDLDNAEKVLLVDLGEIGWTAAEKGAPKSPMIAGWSAQKSASGGASVAIELKKSAKIVSSQYLKAEGADPARLVLDIAPGGV